LFSLFSPWVFIAPHILALKSWVFKRRCFAHFFMGRSSLSSIPWLIQAVFACRVREAHCVLVLESLLLFALLFLGFCILLKLDRLLNVDREKVDVARVVSQWSIARRFAQLQDFCILILTFSRLGYRRR
jgi:hypothetical protein